MIRKTVHDHKVDVYCAGIVFYELLYGTSPFKADTEKQIFENIENK